MGRRREADRIFTNEKKPQIYGTQGAPVYTAAEKARVNRRRKALGLPSMAETARQKARFYEEAYRQAAAGRTPSRISSRLRGCPKPPAGR